MNQAQVISQINSYTAQTGVAAQVAAAGQTNPGATELYTTGFGTAATISVQSNTPEDENGAADGIYTSGFATSLATAHGTNIAGTINGGAATGAGNVLTGNAGTAGAGVSVSAAVAGTTPATDLKTVTGAIGTVSTTANSLTFQVGANAGQTASVSVSNVAANALAVGVSNTSNFGSLASINVTTQQGAADSITLIDAATEQISNLRAQLGCRATVQPHRKPDQPASRPAEHAGGQLRRPGHRLRRCRRPTMPRIRCRCRSAPPCCKTPARLRK